MLVIALIIIESGIAQTVGERHVYRNLRSWQLNRGVVALIFPEDRNRSVAALNVKKNSPLSEVGV